MRFTPLLQVHKFLKFIRMKIWIITNNPLLNRFHNVRILVFSDHGLLHFINWVVLLLLLLLNKSLAAQILVSFLFWFSQVDLGNSNASLKLWSHLLYYETGGSLIFLRVRLFKCFLSRVPSIKMILISIFCLFYQQPWFQRLQILIHLLIMSPIGEV